MAQVALASMCAEERGVLRDNVQAVAWLRKAAEQGFAVAQVQLGLWYGVGEHVPQDSIKALKWLNLAASRTSGKIQKDDARVRDAITQRMPQP